MRAKILIGIAVVLGIIEAALLGVTLGFWHDDQPAGSWGWALVLWTLVIIAFGMYILGWWGPIGRWVAGPHPYLRAFGNTIAHWWTTRAQPALARAANGALGGMLDNILMSLAIAFWIAAAILTWKGRYEGAFYLAMIGTLLALFHFNGTDLVTKGWKWLWLGISSAFFAAGFYFGYSLGTQIFWGLMILAALLTLCGGWGTAGKFLWKIVAFVVTEVGKVLIGQYSREVAVVAWWFIVYALLKVGPADNCGRLVWQNASANCQQVQLWLTWALGLLPLLGGWFLYLRWEKAEKTKQHRQQAQQAQQPQAQQQGNRRRRRRGGGQAQPANP